MCLFYTSPTFKKKKKHLHKVFACKLLSYNTWFCTVSIASEDSSLSYCLHSEAYSIFAGNGLKEAAGSGITQSPTSSCCCLLCERTGVSETCHLNRADVYVSTGHPCENGICNRVAVHSDKDDDIVAMCISVADNEREKNKTRFYLIWCGSSWVVLPTQVAGITKEFSDHFFILLFHLGDL